METRLLINGYDHPSADGSSTTLVALRGDSLDIVCLERASTHYVSLQVGSGRVTTWLMDGQPLNGIRAVIRREFREKCQTIKARSPRTWIGIGDAVRSFPRFPEDATGPIRDHEIASELERVSAEVLDERHGCLKRDGVSDHYRGLERYAPRDLSRGQKRIYMGGLVVLYSLCKHFNVKAVKLQ